MFCNKEFYLLVIEFYIKTSHRRGIKVLLDDDLTSSPLKRYQAGNDCGSGWEEVWGRDGEGCIEGVPVYQGGAKEQRGRVR